uniref:Uncharacterized protein n=1 Tax=Glossina pallidipes TaxID=7398 RepID=A0A1A9ZXW8_GLOPL
MFVCEGRMNSQKYINGLETPPMRRVFDDTNTGDVKFHQNHVLCQKSAKKVCPAGLASAVFISKPHRAHLKCKIRKHSITSDVAVKNSLAASFVQLKRDPRKNTFDNKAFKVIKNLIFSSKGNDLFIEFPNIENVSLNEIPWQFNQKE